ncbi:MAG: hypothetical protein ACLR17_20980 [Enterobacteriaceae bacterium]
MLLLDFKFARHHRYIGDNAPAQTSMATSAPSVSAIRNLLAGTEAVRRRADARHQDWMRLARTAKGD